MARVAMVALLAALLAAFCPRPAGAEPPEHGAPAAEHQARPAAPHGGEHHVPTWQDINWYTGMIAVSKDAEPNLLWRKPGTPAPLLALVLNTAVVYWVLYRFGKKPVREALARRKVTLLRGIEEASAMRDQAHLRLAEYQTKLARIDQDLERLRQEAREAGEAERARVLAEARAKAERLEREARLTLELERKQAQDELMAEAVRDAVAHARQLMTAQILPTDQLRLLNDYLAGLGAQNGGAA